MKLKFLTLFLAMCSVSLLSAQMKKVEFEKYELDNGLKVILHEDHSTPNVSVGVLYHVGSKNENPERTGFAHFFEHLMFEGSKNVQRGEFDKYLDKAGGYNNAYTMEDRTFYYETVPSNQLGLALWLESERMLHAIVDEEGVETQREVVKEERRQSYDNRPYATWREELFRRAFKVHPYRWRTIGSMEHLNAASEDDYKQFYADFYVPNNAVLTIAGDIDMQATKAMIDKYFSTIPASEGPVYRPDVEEPAQTAEIRDTVYDNVQLPALFIGYRNPAQGTDDYYAVSMLNRVLAGGQSARIPKALVDEQKISVQAVSFPSDMEDPGLGAIILIANMGIDPGQLESALDVEIEKVKNELISEREFMKVRNQIESSFIDNIASVSGIAENLAVYEVHYGDANLINTELERYLAVTREDIQRVANKYYNKDQRTILYWLPRPN